MGVLSDLGVGVVAGIHEQTGWPFDEYGHLLRRYSPRDGELEKDWDKVGTKLYSLTNPYGFLSYAVGSGDDFWCFDYQIIPGGYLILDSTINSETGSFIQGGGYKIIDLADPCGYDYDAHVMIRDALDWCYLNGIRHSKKGWNQDPWYFARCVHVSIQEFHKDLTGPVPIFSNRQFRFGGKRINKYCGIQS